MGTQNIEVKKKKYEIELQSAIQEYNRLGVIIRQLEGAIMACNELIKENKEENNGISGS